MARRTKRLWTDEEKRLICFQTAAPGVSVAQVALRYAVNANLIFKWRRDPRYAPDPMPTPGLSECSRFLPVEIVEAVKVPPVAVNAGVKLGHVAAQNWATLGLCGTRVMCGGQSCALPI